MNVPTFTLIVHIDPTEAIGDCSSLVDRAGQLVLVIPHTHVSPAKVGRVVLELIDGMQP